MKVDIEELMDLLCLEIQLPNSSEDIEGLVVYADGVNSCSR